MQVEKIQLKSIKLESLNSECLLAVNRCARYLKRHHGEVIRLQERDVLLKLSKLVREIESDELNTLYRDLKTKMVASLRSSRNDDDRA